VHLYSVSFFAAEQSLDSVYPGLDEPKSLSEMR